MRMTFSTVGVVFRCFSVNFSLFETEAQEVRNERAVFVYNRVQHKLTGTFLFNVEYGELALTRI